MNVNEPDSELYNAFRGPPGRQKLKTGFYKPAAMLKKLADELKIELQLRPRLFFAGRRTGYPPGFDCPNDFKGSERRACSKSSARQNFTAASMRCVCNTFTVVMRMTPVLKDFMLFVDKIAAEQGRDKIGPNDHLNIMFTKRVNTQKKPTVRRSAMPATSESNPASNTVR